MEKNVRKEIAKKIAVAILILVVLQSYLVSFAYVVKATSEIVIGESENAEVVAGTSENDDEQLDQNQDNEQLDAVSENEVVIGEDVETEVTESSEEKPEEVSEDEAQSPEIEEPEETTVEEDSKTEDEYVEPSLDLTVTSENTSIYKGYLYANATSELKYATNYNTIDSLNITGGKNITSIEVQDEPDKIELITNTKIGLLSDMYYKQTRISVEEFNQILGEDGSINLYDENDELIGTISKDTNIQNDEYTFTYPYQTNSVKFELTGIQGDGSLEIKNDKAIKEDTLYSRSQISLFTAINTIAHYKMTVGEEVTGNQVEGNINLEETESKMTIDIDNTTLSVEETNEIAISVTLKTDQERYDLFENPEIVLEFPSAVENLEVTGINLLYKNGLSIETWNIYTNTIGKQVLDIRLTGSQQDYTPGSVQEGTTVVIYANVDVNRLTADTSENLKMTYTNKDTIRKSYMLEGKESEDVTLNFVGKQEIVKASKLSIENVGSTISYDDNIEKIMVDSENENEQEVTVTGSIVNNFETTVENVVIVGRIPFTDNEDGNGNNLGSNFDTKLKSEIALSGVVADVYYSEDGKANKDDTSWTQDVSNLENFKSYKIVVREASLAKGERLDFSFDLKVPANVGYNAKSYTTYTVYYTIDNQVLSGINTVEIYTEEKELSIDDLEEDAKNQVATLTVGTQVTGGTKVLEAGDEVFERQILKYTVVVTNTSNTTAKNIKIKANAINANLYSWDYITFNNGDGVDRTSKKQKEFTKEEMEFEEFEIESLKAGESKTLEFQVVVNSLDEIETENAEVYGNIKISADNIDEVEISTIKNVIEEAGIEISVEKNGTEAVDLDDNQMRGMFAFAVNVKNISGRKMENVQIDTYVSDTLSFDLSNVSFYSGDNDNYEIDIQKTTNGNKLVITVKNMPEDYSERIVVYTTINSADYLVETEDLSVYSIAQEVYMSNILKRTAYQYDSKLEYTWKNDNSNSKLANDDEVTFELTLKNVGNHDIAGLNISSDFSSGFEVTEGKIISVDSEEEMALLEAKNKYTTDAQAVNLTIKAGEEITVKIVAKVNYNLLEKDQLVVEARINVENGLDIYTFTTDVVSYEVENWNVTVNVDSGDDDMDMDMDMGSTDSNDSSDYEDTETPDDTIDSSNTTDTVIDGQTSDSVNTDITTTQVTKTTYNISGKVWIDKNKDGIKDSSEDGKEAVVVMLYGASSDGGVDTSNLIYTVSTDSNGEYKFEKVETGNYVVVFSYDTSVYNVTKYQVSTATSGENSNAVSKKINGSQIYGMTDVLEVKNSSLININMGLVTKNDFDLSLEKYLSKVVVKNDEGQTLYDYENGETERVEIRSKYYKSSTVDITYKIIVKNDGEISGYVNKIVDYMPSGMTVDLNENPGWYYGDDGNLYYNGLVGKEIEAGESEEITLTLTKSLADGSAVKIVNSAEIVDYTNSLGAEDKDSVANNKEAREDDYGEAILMVSVATGISAQSVITILTTIIMIAGIGMLIVKTKINKKIYR